MDTTEKTAGSNLTSIAEYSETAMVMADLRSRHEGVVYDVAAPKQMKLAKEARAEIRGYRVALEKTRVEIKAPALERCRQIDSEAKRLTAELVALEEPIDVQIKAEEARAEAEKLAKLEAERQRVEALQAKIDAIRNVPAGLVGKPSVIIAGQLAKLEAEQLDEDEFGEHFATARDALEAAIARVKQQHADQVEHEAEQKRIAAEREELARMRAENERRQREAEERRAADEERERAARVEAEQKERQTREIEDARVQNIRDHIIEISFVAPIANWSSEKFDGYVADRRKLDPRDADNDFDYGEWQSEACDAFDKAMGHYVNMRQEIVAREREEYEAAERRAEQERELAAERERQAEAQRKLDEQAEQLRKERAEAAKKAEADRLANLGLREAAQAVVDCYFGMDESNVRDELLDQLVGDLRVALSNDENCTAKAVTVNRTKRAARA